MATVEVSILESAMDSKSPESGVEQAPVSVWRGQRQAEGGSVPPPKPFWFGKTDRPLFGWYHAPAEQQGRASIVLCNPFGHEAMVQHRSYRRLAQRLASEGYASLRFDYDGTGDSAGTDDEPNRVEAWLESIRRAINEVVVLSGAERVVLFGTRFGALLASTYAARSPLDGLVLVAPPRSGNAWLREMRAMQAVKGVHMAQQAEGIRDDFGIAGYLLDGSSRQSVMQLDPSKLRERPARHALIVCRDDLPGGEDRLNEHFLNLGVDTELCVAPGYAESMPEDPFKAVVPTRQFDAIVSWLNRQYGRDHESKLERMPTGPASSRPSLTTMALPTRATREQVVDIGGLFGILTEPLVPSSQTRTAVLLLNIGANHHIGSNRMYVHLARAWAAEGFQVLRMDFSGMGDSSAIPGGAENEVYASRFMAEARSSIDFAHAQGATRVVLMGLCSGAYVAYHTAIADPRVSGVVMINPLTFHWTEGDSLEVRLRNSFKSSENYRRRLFQVETWMRIARGDVGVAAITGELARRTQRRATREAKSLLARLTGEIAEATDIERGFRRLCARGTQCLLVFGAEDGGIDVIEEHLGRDAAEMRRVDGFRMEVMEGPDHTFTPLWTQQRLTQLLTDYLVSHQLR